MNRAILPLGLLLLFTVPASGGELPFDAEHWDLTAAAVTEHLGRTSLTGTAVAKGVEMADGVLEVDIAVTGARSYPGVMFRRQSTTELERFYIRPHRGNGAFSDALQYTPTIGGIAGWQLYSGDGFTAAATLPAGEWIPLRIEFAGSQGRVYVGGMETPAVVINRLQHGAASGGIGVLGPRDGSAYFSNFRYRAADDLTFDPPPPPPHRYGMIDTWRISQVFPDARVDKERTPEQQGAEITWDTVDADATGLVDIARYRQRLRQGPDWVWAETTIHAEADETRPLRFGYSDVVHVFVNDARVFSGDSSYRSRSPGFSGIVGLNDEVHLSLKEGDNRVLLLVGESFGGWGLIAQDAGAVLRHDEVRPLWNLSQTLHYPESVVYHAGTDALYASNYYRGGNEYISKIATDGTVIDLEWIAGLRMPTGLCVTGDRMFAVQRTGLVEIDVPAGEIVRRMALPGAGLLNDVACDDAGNVFVSDSRRGAIYRWNEDGFESFVEGAPWVQPNGLLLDGDRLVVGCSGDGCVRSVSLADTSVETIACLGPDAIMDGLRSDGSGGLIISDFNGRVVQVAPSGETTVLLDTSATGMFAADFEYVPAQRLLVVPTLNDNRVVAYEYPAE